MISLRIALIGAGRVGSALGLAFHKKRHSIVSVVSRTKASTQRLARATRSPHAATSVSALPASVNCIVVATSDDAIGSVAKEIAAHPDLDFKKLIVFHTSGALTSDLLDPLAQRGATVFSLHPIQTFPKLISARDQIRAVEGIWYGCEGLRGYRTAARRIAKELGGRIVFVPKEKKILYHIACVFASNYSMVLLGAAEMLAKEAGLRSLEPLKRLVETSFRHGLEHGPTKALTGPLTRGSVDILQRHMEEMTEKSPELLPVYSALALFGLTIGAKQGRLSEDDIEKMTKVLAGKS